MIRSFLLQLQFFTRIPVPVKIEFDDTHFAKGIIFAPVIGFIIGVMLCVIFLLFNKTGAGALSALSVVIAEILISGGLHMDGLADTFDGIPSNRPADEILKIMKDSRIGTNGTLALILTILAKTMLIMSLNISSNLYIIILMPAVSRMSISWSSGISSYAGKKKGLGTAYINNTGIREIIISTALTAAAGTAMLGIRGPLLIIPAIIFTLLFTTYVKKKIGGTTGDILGAVIEMSEIVFLLSAHLIKPMRGS